MRYIIKTVGAASGKGVLVTDSYLEAMSAISAALRNGLTVTAKKEDGVPTREDN